MLHRRVCFLLSILLPILVRIDKLIEKYKLKGISINDSNSYVIAAFTYLSEKHTVRGRVGRGSCAGRARVRAVHCIHTQRGHFGGSDCIERELPPRVRPAHAFFVLYSIKIQRNTPAPDPRPTRALVCVRCALMSMLSSNIKFTFTHKNEW